MVFINRKHNSRNFFLLQKAFLTVLFFLFFFLTFSQHDISTIPLNDDKPLTISISLHINKIYNINTVDESYQIDGYLLVSWFDERLKFNQNSPTGTLIYENDKATELIKNEIWFPAFEFMNIQGIRETHNMSIEIQSNGMIDYDERFSGTFSSNMDYRKFPFDSQHFKVLIEAYSYDERYLTFNDLELYPRMKESQGLMDKWEIKSIKTYVESIKYDELNSIYNQTTNFTRAVFVIDADRLSGYFVWQVLFPILVIIMASFVVFWIADFSTQIGIGFTLMLTVVAFNFYSVTILIIPVQTEPLIPIQTEPLFRTKLNHMLKWN